MRVMKLRRGQLVPYRTTLCQEGETTHVVHSPDGSYSVIAGPLRAGRAVLHEGLTHAEILILQTVLSYERPSRRQQLVAIARSQQAWTVHDVAEAVLSTPEWVSEVLRVDLPLASLLALETAGLAGDSYWRGQAKELTLLQLEAKLRTKP